MWINPRQPQTLYLSQILMYIQGGIRLIFSLMPGYGPGGLFGVPLLGEAYWLLTGPGKVGAAFGISNSKPWGYKLGVAAAAAPLALRLLAAAVHVRPNVIFTQPYGLLFDIALLALLLHRNSRGHVRYWD